MESPTLSNQGMSPLPAEGRWLGEGGEPNIRMISGEEELAVVHAGETEGPAGPPLWLPLVILLVATAVVRFCNLDLWLARRVYAGDGDWTFDLHLLVQALYRYGTWPAVLVSVAAAVVLVGSRYVRRLRSGRLQFACRNCPSIDAVQRGEPSEPARDSQLYCLSAKAGFCLRGGVH
jgi:hypothetical protein